MRIVKIDRLIVALSIFSGLLVSLGRSTQIYPQQISGNGNLGFLPLLLLLLLFPIGIVLVLKWIREAQLRFLSLIGLSTSTTNLSCVWHPLSNRTVQPVSSVGQTTSHCRSWND